MSDDDKEARRQAFTKQLSDDTAEAYRARTAFLAAGGTHQRFAIEFPDHAWHIACNVMSKTEGRT